MAIHAMIDLETLATSPQATVLTVGGVKFDPYSDVEPHSEFYFRLDTEGQDRDINEDTLAWWGRQDPKAQEEAFGEENRVTAEDFLSTLPKWMNGVDVLWGHGYGFDITILEDMLRQVGRSIPWQFWQVRDSRTLFAMMKQDPRKGMQTDLHNALADAFYQAKGVQLAYEELNLS
jgi:exodeoxyribonuclease VIII